MFFTHMLSSISASILLWVFVGDKLVGEVSRIVVAEACIQALDIEFTQGQIYEINSVEVISINKLLVKGYLWKIVRKFI